MKSVLAIASFVAFGLVGCAHYHPVESVSYNDGFNDGCVSGCSIDVNPVKQKDFHRTVHDRAYMHGWDEGFSECRYNAYMKKRNMRK